MSSGHSCLRRQISFLLQRNLNKWASWRSEFLTHSQPETDGPPTNTSRQLQEQTVRELQGFQLFITESKQCIKREPKMRKMENREKLESKQSRLSLFESSRPTCGCPPCSWLARRSLLATGQFLDLWLTIQFPLGSGEAGEKIHHSFASSSTPAGCSFRSKLLLEIWKKYQETMKSYKKHFVVGFCYSPYCLHVVPLFSRLLRVGAFAIGDVSWMYYSK